SDWLTAMTWHATWQVNVRSTSPDHQSTATVYGGDRRSMAAVKYGRRWRSAVNDGSDGGPSSTTTGPPLTTTGPPVNGG
nr:hypothetical protein [Tanacetum cinerariifolium]GEZ04932.1 hypothetical protein [Tanacetum cinerariifolium]